MTEHTVPTAGPYWIEDRRLTHPQSGIKSGGQGILILGAPSGPGSSFCVAMINPYGIGNMADAHLLAASWEMLAALKAMVAAYDGDAKPADYHPPGECPQCDAALAAIAVIAKAEGRA